MMHAELSSRPTPDPAGLQIYLLGGFRVLVGGREIGAEAWRLRKASSLVKLLALAPGQQLHREQVSEQLWPERPPEAAANNLRVTLHTARRLLETPDSASPIVLFRGERLALDPRLPVWVDVVAFEEAAGRCAAGPAAYEVALSLYTGDLLPDDPYEEWLNERREALRQTYLRLLLGLARLREDRGETERAIVAFKQVVAHEAAHEEAHVRLMRAHALAGNRRQALRQYQHLRDALQSDLDVEPDPVSQRLYEAILTHRFPGQAPLDASWILPSHVARPLVQVLPEAGSNLPSETSSFVGRSREIHWIKQALAQHRLVTLTGAGGSGKTRLALRAASGLTNRYPDGVYLADLSALSHPGLVMTAVAAALGVREDPDESASSTIAGFIGNTRLLLVLDNCEHLMDAAASLVDDLLRGCPHLRVLVTSREPLRASGEAILRVPPMPTPKLGDTQLEHIASADAVRLFVERARMNAPAFVLTEQNARAVSGICVRLDGMPLAIELAAARVRVLQVEQIAGRLDDALRLLSSGARTAPGRQRTLQASIDWSHDLLDTDERAIMRRFATFAGGCTLEAAESVCAGDGIAADAAIDLLFHLVDKSLILVEELDGEVRYRMLEPIRQYAAQRLEDAGETDALYLRHLNWCRELAEKSDVELRGSEQREWLRRLEREHDNMRVALGRMMAAGDIEAGLWLATALWRFWHAHGYLSEGRSWLERLLDPPGSIQPTLARTRALFAHGRLAYAQRDFAAAKGSCEKSLMLASALEDRDYIAGSLVQLGLIALAKGNYDEARARLEAGTSIQRELADPWFIAIALIGLGKVALAQRQLEESRALFEESLALFRQERDEIQVGQSLSLLAQLAHEEGDEGAAREFHQESLAIWRAVEHRLHMADSLQSLGRIAVTRGDSEHALRLFAESLELYQELEIQQGIDDCVDALAKLG